ncbi:MAG: iron-containing redox enzyme family protein [Alphaproteobacteria bacterium]|nr:iron-containing redox enzyme family protein [Alphaproteobacteria bacterium]
MTERTTRRPAEAGAASFPSPAADPQGFHEALSWFNRRRLAARAPHDGWEAELEAEQAARLAEGSWIEAERRAVESRAKSAPSNCSDFVAWFEELKASGPGQGDPLFPWLAETATREEMRWFLQQEVAGEAGFDDLVAMTQVKMPPQPKMELANNYWDEMGRGNIKGMHGPMLDALALTLDLKPSIEGTVWESLALANTMVAFATSRRYAWHAVGALGVVELTAPGRSKLVAQGLKRLGLSNRERLYFDLHAVLDVKHSEDWNREVLRPLVAEDPARARWIAEGALMRLSCGARCFARYRRELWGAVRLAAE